MLRNKDQLFFCSAGGFEAGEAPSAPPRAHEKVELYVRISGGSQFGLSLKLPTSGCSAVHLSARRACRSQLPSQLRSQPLSEEFLLMPACTCRHCKLLFFLVISGVRI
jgi:hypothetical protein